MGRKGKFLGFLWVIPVYLGLLAGLASVAHHVKSSGPRGPASQVAPPMVVLQRPTLEVLPVAEPVLEEQQGLKVNPVPVPEISGVKGKKLEKVEKVEKVEKTKKRRLLIEPVLEEGDKH